MTNTIQQLSLTPFSIAFQHFSAQMQTPQLTNHELITNSDKQSNKNINFPSDQIGNNLSSGYRKKECRVCFEPEAGNRELITTCKCTGVLQFIHRECFEVWLLRKYQESENRENFMSGHGLFCEICHSNYTVNYSIAKKLTSSSNFLKKIKTNKWIALANLLFIIVDILCLSFSSYYASNDLQDPEFDLTAPKYFLVYVAIFLAICSTIYGVYQFVRVFMLEEIIIVEKKAKYSQSPQKKYICQAESPSISAQITIIGVRAQN